ncbi:FMRFamide receptor [Plakobranchus ocellatus]|uniref:FMRFamide receptor n=1 Tax=Plakobranchus ocellatus TaxID=259542 RepID=A0AAV3YP94_9GAST|nr:FMRFamide receptor [Plakobranchus ocellatus]
MRTSTNVYLLVLSLADTIYLLLNIVLSQLSCSKQGLSLAAYQFNPYGRFISNFSGNVAVWITVVFTVERYLAVCHPIHGKVWCTVGRAKLASLAATLFVLINVMPTLFELEVVVETVAATGVPNGNGSIINTTATAVTTSIANINNNINRSGVLGKTDLGYLTTASRFGARSDGTSSDFPSSRNGNFSEMLTAFLTTPSLVVSASVENIVSKGTIASVFNTSGEQREGAEMEASLVRRPKCVDTDLAKRWSYEKGYSWWYVTVFSFVPLFSLAIFNTVLIRTLILAGKKRQQLALISTGGGSTNATGGGGCASKPTPCMRGGNRLTKKEKKQMKKMHKSCGDNNSSTMYDGVSASQLSNNHGSFHDTVSHSSVSTALTNKRQTRRISREQNKVTLLLVTIVMIFILCQLPWTVLYLYKTCGPKMTKSSITYVKIAGNVCNLLSLINASVNFYLYSFFSKRFRRTLAKLVLCWRRKRNMSPTTV